MANTFGPFGFRQRTGTGSSPTYEQVEMLVSSSNTGAIFAGDPVMPAAGATGLPTGYITQGYGPVSLTVSGIVVTAGVAVATFTAVTTGVPTSPNNWAPPVGATLVLTGTSFATGGGLNGAFPITASTTTTVTFPVTGAYSSTLTFGTATVYVPVVGVFGGCHYLSVVQKRTVWSNYWPGSDANTSGAVAAFVVNDPDAQFLVSTANSNTTASAMGIANIGLNIGFSTSASGLTTTNGNTSTGLSTMFADQFTAGPTLYLPFNILSLPNYGPISAGSGWSGVNGFDPATAYNNLVVGFNNAMLKQLAGL